MPEVPFSFDPTVLRGGAGGHRRTQPKQPKFISGPLPPPPADDVSLADLVGFFKDPVKGFFRALEFTLPCDVDGVAGRHAGRHQRPRGVDGRRPDAGRHPARDDARMTRGRPSGAAARCRPASWAGARPPRFAIRPRCWRPRHCSYRQGATRGAYDVDIDLGVGRRLTGTVSPVYGDRLVSVTYSKLDGKHLLESWIPLLALIAHDPGRDWSAVCIGRRKQGHHPAGGGPGAAAGA